MPVISLTDRRAAGNRLVRFVFQRHLETVLYGRSEGSSGPIWKAMNAAGIGSTTMTINKAAVTAGLVTDDEFKAIMDTFKSALPADVVDPCSLGRIRNCTILPLAAAATVVRTFGRSAASMAWLRALSQPVPQAWELREEQEANDAAGEVDLLLNDKLDDANFEADESSFAAELMTMPAFSADREDEERLKTYILQRVPPELKKDLETYLLYRTETFAGAHATPHLLLPSRSAHTLESPLRLGSSPCGWRGAVHLGGGRQHGTAALLWLDGSHQQAIGRRVHHVHDPRRSWRHCSRVCAVASEHAALQVQHHRQLHQRLGEHHVVLLRQPGTQRRAAGNGSQPVDPADQLARTGGEG